MESSPNKSDKASKNYLELESFGKKFRRNSPEKESQRSSVQIVSLSRKPVTTQSSVFDRPNSNQNYVSSRFPEERKGDFETRSVHGVAI
jgi:hypothetical protein